VRLRVSTSVVRFVLGLCEQPEPVVQACGSPSTGCIGEAVQHGLLERIRDAEWVTCSACHEDHDAPIEFDGATRTYRHFCPEAGHVLIDAQRLRRYGVDFGGLINQLRFAFNVRDKPDARCLVDGLLWDLGDAIIDKANTPLLLARRLSCTDSLMKSRDALVHRPSRSSGLCFHTSPAILPIDTVPGGHRVVSLLDCISDSAQFSIDHKLMQAAWHGGLRETRSPVQHSPDFGSVSVHGVVFTFRSDGHRSIVRQLYEAWRDGSGSLVTGRVLKEAGYTSTQLSHAFSNSTVNWRRLIGYRAGRCWLKVDDFDTADSNS